MTNIMRKAAANEFRVIAIGPSADSSWRHWSMRALAAWTMLLAGSAAFAQSATLTTLLSFGGSANGSSPNGSLVQGTDGNFYGTTTTGGTSNDGTVFSITPDGTLTTLYTFAGTDGAKPDAGLLLATDGNFYGTTQSGGVSNDGTVFSINSSGILTTLHSFSGTDGSSPYAGLIEGSDGNLYGTTTYGGSSANNGTAHGYGTVFSMTTSGTLTTLHNFALNDGANPTGSLVLGSDGNFYGTTSLGGGYDSGSVFQITSSGTLTSLFAFNFSDGYAPGSNLVQGSDGNFYGTTQGGGTSSYASGTIFEITTAGALTTLYTFDGYWGVNPYSGLLLGTDGNFYGTTVFGGFYGPTCYSDCGTVFSITPSGTLTNLISFNQTDGGGPYGSLVQGSDGNFYGTTGEGGANGGATGYGTVFEFSVQPDDIATPTFTPSGGTFSSEQTVTLSESTPNTTIYYSMGSFPANSSSNVYTGPFTVSTTETINAIAITTGGATSPVSVASFTIGNTGSGGGSSSGGGGAIAPPVLGLLTLLALIRRRRSLC